MQVHGEVRDEGAVRPHQERFLHWPGRQGRETMARKRMQADLLFRRVGIIFAVKGGLSET